MGWIGVDLDGTLAHYDGWKGADHIGEPVQPMLERVVQWMREGKEVRIFTARASNPRHIAHVRFWLQRHGLGSLKVTNEKDYAMDVLWDDRCVQVAPNTGLTIEEAVRTRHG